MGKTAVEAVLRFQLNNGASIHAVGLGTWQAVPTNPGVVGQAVKEAIKIGYRHIDCAMVYKNEKEIGDALQELFKERIVKREDLFITSKLWCSDNHSAAVAGALDGSIERLQCDYLDLHLMHWPIASKKGNFSVEKIKDLLSHCKVRPAVNQVECHPLWRQKKLAPYLKAEDIHFSVNVLELPTVTKCAEKYGKTPAETALRWNVQQGHSVLPKSTNASKLASNIELFDFEIFGEDLQEFDKIEQYRLFRGDEVLGFANYTNSPYKTVEEIWDKDI